MNWALDHATLLVLLATVWCAIGFAIGLTFGLVIA